MKHSIRLLSTALVLLAYTTLSASAGKVGPNGSHAEGPSTSSPTGNDTVATIRMVPPYPFDPLPWPHLWLGVSLGGDLALHYGYSSSAFGSGPASGTGGGVALGYSIGLVGEYLLFDKIYYFPGHPLPPSLLVHLYYSNRSITLEDSGPAVTLTDPSNTDITVPSRYRSDIDYRIFEGDIQYGIRIDRRLIVSVGPSIGYLSTVTRKETIVPETERRDVTFPPDPVLAYENDRRTLVLSDGEMDRTSHLRIGLTAEARVEMRLFRKIFVMPTLAYDHALTSVASGTSWHVGSLRFGLTFITGATTD